MKVNSYAGLYECPMTMPNIEAVIANVRSIKLQVREVLQVYPNPADTYVTLEHTLSPEAGYAFRVIDAMGYEQLYYELHDTEILYEWNVQHLIQGVYYVFLYKEGVITDYKLLSILH